MPAPAETANLPPTRRQRVLMLSWEYPPVVVGGLDLAARAGYNPRAAITLWEKMGAAAKGAPPQWLSTHPAGSTRIHDIEQNLPAVEPLYARAEKPRQRFTPAG